jgi:hypothetical protein
MVSTNTVLTTFWEGGLLLSFPPAIRPAKYSEAKIIMPPATADMMSFRMC